MTRNKFEQLADEAEWTKNEKIRDSAFQTMPTEVMMMPEEKAILVAKAFLINTKDLAVMFAGLR